MTTVIEAITLYLRGKGYIVATEPQEKSYNKQIIITLDDILYEVESPVSYFMDVTIYVKYMCDDPDDMIDICKTLPFNIEYMLREHADLTDLLTLIIQTPTIERSGRLYEVLIPIMYREQIMVQGD